MSTPMEGSAATDIRGRWWALAVLCLTVLMCVIDGTIVVIAMPFIKADLGFTETSLVWIPNAYFLTFGGFLLLSGRLVDLFGQRRLFLVGVVLLTLGSLGCGFAWSQVSLLTFRATQGLGAAVISTSAASLILRLFKKGAERPKVMSIFNCVNASGQSVALLLGGALVGGVSWHWVFLINVPVGIAVYVLGLMLLPRDPGRTRKEPLDVAGAVTVTAFLALVLYAMLSGEAGRPSAQTLVLLVTAAGFLYVFFYIETRVRAPLVPLRLFRQRNVNVTSLIRAALATAILVWAYLSSLYLQLVLKYDPLQVALAFLPGAVITAMSSLALSAKLVARFGIKPQLTVGLLLIAVGLLLLARAPLGGTLSVDVLPAMILISVGNGMAAVPLWMATISGMAPSESGIVSGVAATSSVIGGLLGFAMLAWAAAARSNELRASGVSFSDALNGGYHIAFLLGAALAVMGAVASAAFLRDLEESSEYVGRKVALSVNVADD